MAYYYSTQYQQQAPAALHMQGHRPYLSWAAADGGDPPRSSSIPRHSTAADPSGPRCEFGNGRSHWTGHWTMSMPNSNSKKSFDLAWPAIPSLQSHSYPTHSHPAMSYNNNRGYSSRGGGGGNGGYRPGGGQHGTPRPNYNSQPNQQQYIPYVERGPQSHSSTWPAGATLVTAYNIGLNSSGLSAVRFYVGRANNSSNKASIEVLDSWREGSNLFILVKTPVQAQELTRLSGIKYDGVITTVRLANQPSMQPPARPQSAPAGSGQKPDVAQRLTECIERRYDSATQTLDLSDWRSEPFLRTIGPLRQEVLDTIRAHMWGIITKHNVAIRGISLANNRLGNLSEWGEFLCKFPGLVSLNLSKNNLTGFASFDPINSTTHPLLASIDCRQNPLVPNSHAQRESHVRKMRDRFPALSMLDGQELVQLAIAVEEDVFPPVLASSFHSPDVRDPALQQFLQAFMQAFDGDRNQLMAVYHSDAQFSVVAIGPFRGNYGTSRNLSESNVPLSSESRFNRLHYGPKAIISAINQLPATQHIVDTIVMDAWSNPVLGPPGTPLVTAFIHGNLTEREKYNSRSRNQTSATRSFDRTLALIPAPPGSPSPFLIVHDQLLVRQHVPVAPWKGAPATAQEAEQRKQQQQQQQQASGAASTTAPSLPGLPPKPPAMSDAEYQLVVQAMQQFGLTYDGAIHCLQVTSGDLTQIAAAKNAGQIPPNCFRQ